MLGDKSEPTRYELLSMVRKHSDLLGETTRNEDGVSDVERDSCFWHDIIDLYFVRGTESRGCQDDDLMFFVSKKGSQGHGFSDNVETNSPYFVRRWALKLDDLVGQVSINIDWRRSFYLNLIAHTSFSVTVAICSHRVLQQYQTGKDRPLSPIYKVVKTVYASPSRINFHLDSTKEVETIAAYPDIFFAVDDFDFTSDAVVLNDTDHCYCVVLNAHDGAAFPSEQAQKASSSDTFSKTDKSPRKMNSKITVFSGFVNYQMVRKAYDAGRTGIGSLLSLGNFSSKTDRICMKGPGGCGEVEVAVSGFPDQSKQESGPHSPIQISKRGLGIGTIFRKAASVATMAAKQAYAATSTSRTEEEMLLLRCCLVSISLPWEHIARDLLVKGSPPVKL